MRKGKRFVTRDARREHNAMNARMSSAYSYHVRVVYSEDPSNQVAITSETAGECF